MVIILNELWSRRIQEANSFPFLIPLPFTSPLAHVSSPIVETIHVSPLITTIEKNKIVSLLFNVELNIFTNSLSSLPHLYIYVVTFIHFNYLILKCPNNTYSNFTRLIILDFSILNNFACCYTNHTRLFHPRLFTLKEDDLPTNHTRVLCTYSNFTRLIILDFSILDNFACCYTNHTRLFHSRLFTLKNMTCQLNKPNVYGVKFH